MGNSPNSHGSDPCRPVLCGCWPCASWKSTSQAPSEPSASGSVRVDVAHVSLEAGSRSLEPPPNRDVLADAHNDFSSRRVRGLDQVTACFEFLDCRAVAVEVILPETVPKPRSRCQGNSPSILYLDHPFSGDCIIHGHEPCRREHTGHVAIIAYDPQRDFSAGISTQCEHDIRLSYCQPRVQRHPLTSCRAKILNAFHLHVTPPLLTERQRAVTRAPRRQYGGGGPSCRAYRPASRASRNRFFHFADERLGAIHALRGSPCRSHLRQATEDLKFRRSSRMTGNVLPDAVLPARNGACNSLWLFGTRRASSKRVSDRDPLTGESPTSAGTSEDEVARTARVGV